MGSGIWLMGGFSACTISNVKFVGTAARCRPCEGMPCREPAFGGHSARPPAHPPLDMTRRDLTDARGWRSCCRLVVGTAAHSVLFYLGFRKFVGTAGNLWARRLIVYYFIWDFGNLWARREICPPKAGFCTLCRNQPASGGGQRQTPNSVLFYL